MCRCLKSAATGCEVHPQTPGFTVLKFDVDILEDEQHHRVRVRLGPIDFISGRMDLFAFGACTFALDKDLF